MKWHWVLVVGILLASSAFALSVQTDKKSAEKGDIVNFSGTCLADQSVKVKATRQNIPVLDAQFDCPSSGEWSVPQEIGFLEPSGKWLFSFQQAGETKTVLLTVRPSRSSSLLVMDFFNYPSPQANRLDSLVLDLRLREGGKAVEGAQVFFWDWANQKKELEGIGNGIYKGVLQLPLSAPLGDFNLVLVAEKTDENKHRGGEFFSTLSIQPAVIVLTIQKPSRFSLEVGKPVEWEVKATYADQSPLQEPKLFLILDNGQYEFTKKTETTFSASFIPLEKDATTKTIRISAEDAFGNRAETERKAVFSSGTYAGIFNIFIWLLLLGILALGFAKVVYPKIRQTKTAVQRPGLEREIRENIKRIQIQYYQEQSIDRKEYREKLAELQKKLDELKQP